MKKHSFLAALALGLFLMAAFPVYAAGQGRFTLPVTVTWGQGGLNKEKTYQLTLKGLEDTCPMPSESSLTLTRNSTLTELPEILYERPGDYQYRLTLTREDGKQIALYYLHVMVLNGDNGGLTVASTLREKDPKGAKTDRLQFVDDTQEKPEQKPDKKPGKKEEQKKPSQTGGRVQTGDENAAVFWLLLLLTGVCGLRCCISQLLLDIKRK